MVRQAQDLSLLELAQDKLYQLLAAVIPQLWLGTQLYTKRALLSIPALLKTMQPLKKLWNTAIKSSALYHTAMAMAVSR